jgi:hypothetical protein
MDKKLGIWLRKPINENAILATRKPMPTDLIPLN